MARSVYTSTQQVDDDLRTIIEFAESALETAETESDEPLDELYLDEMRSLLGLCVPSFRPSLKRRRRSEATCMQDVAGGWVFTSDEYPWPEGHAPYFQLDLDKLGLAAGIPVGTGILQAWGTSDWYPRLDKQNFIRVIPRRAFKAKVLAPLPENAEDLVENWSGRESLPPWVFTLEGWSRAGIFPGGGNWLPEALHETGPRMVKSAAKRLRAFGVRQYSDGMRGQAKFIRAFGVPEPNNAVASELTGEGWKLLVELTHDFGTQIVWNFGYGTTQLLYRRKARRKTRGRSKPYWACSNLCEAEDFQYVLHADRF